MRRTRRKYSKDEKMAAIRCLENGESIHLNPELVRRWRTEWHKYGDHAFSGCGNPRLVKPQKTEPVVFRVKPAEYERLVACVESSDARTLSDFVRRQLFETQPEPVQMERKIEDLTVAVKQLSRIVAKTGK